MYFAPLNYWPRRYWAARYWPVGLAQAVELDAAAATLLAEVLTVVPGAYTAALDVLSVAAAAETLTVVPGDVSVLLDGLGLGGVTETVSVSMSTLLAAIALAAAAMPTSLDMGPVEVELGPLVNLLSVGGLTVVPGDVAVLLDALAAAGTVWGAEVTGVTIDYVIELARLGLGSLARPVTIVPGPMTVGLNGLDMNAVAERLLLFTLLGCAIATMRATAQATTEDRSPFAAAASDRSGCR